jgi:putative DNA methylase
VLPPANAQGRYYGFRSFADYFTTRQLTILLTFCDLIQDAQKNILNDALKAGMPDDGIGIAKSGTGATSYAEAVATYLAFAIDKAADYGNSLCTWNPVNENIGHLFTKQGIPMAWDFAESSFFYGGLSFEKIATSVAESLKGIKGVSVGQSLKLDAASSALEVGKLIISTDPPYYDNIGYSDLSDFFYVWLRRSLSKYYPDLFLTLLSPKEEELVATPHRFEGDTEKAKLFFEAGLSKAFSNIKNFQHYEYPITIYYAFRQVEENEDNGEMIGSIASTGWETMLEGLLRAGFQITGTWPMRSERAARSTAIGTNALASSIVLACRPRTSNASMTTRRDFLSALKKELPHALRKLQQGNIAPVDLAQASIGPGMAIFSRHSKVIEADGSPMKVRTALALINQTLDEVLVEQEGEFDSDTRWAVAWFEQFGMNEGPYGVAETLSKAKNTSVEALAQDGFLTAKAGKVRLFGRDELQADWDPAKDKRLTVWEITHYLIRALEQRGEQGAAALLSRVGDLGEIARDLAYRLYVICERKGWAQEGLVYNSLVISWPEITRLVSHERPEEQLGLI